MDTAMVVPTMAAMVIVLTTAATADMAMADTAALLTEVL